MLRLDEPWSVTIPLRHWHRNTRDRIPNPRSRIPPDDRPHVVLPLRRAPRRADAYPEPGRVPGAGAPPRARPGPGRPDPPGRRRVLHLLGPPGLRQDHARPQIGRAHV